MSEIHVKNEIWLAWCEPNLLSGNQIYHTGDILLPQKLESLLFAVRRVIAWRVIAPLHGALHAVNVDEERVILFPIRA